ncbi:MAG: rod shape-determining protein RodA [Ruminobacter sp.]|uniref:Peptidoglycan glycosyltransferase MrdB n=1 Tax=Ruminobacter amylophilus TaxID=867 RepID=A0A662ZDR6_9GAMM|nr:MULTISPECIES: rod shape-determining protein RodA [Ruminobacter]MBQ3774826.1 rod shape-determining protein RodA [Ruminobacter sp.]SFO96099.1 rod shape determining protein RodA [Ruminobacter amylophilus]
MSEVYDNYYDGFSRKKTLSEKLHIDIPLLGGLAAALVLSLFVLYSASGQHYEMLLKQILHTGLSFGLMVIIAQINVKFFERWAPVIFVFCLLMLLGVTFFGEISKGARRWLNLGIIRIQPSEFFKIAMPITIAAVIAKEAIPPRIIRVIWAGILVAIPSALIAKQPDLGTAILVATTGCIAIFLGGVSWWFIIACIMVTIPIIPFLWMYVLHDYQKQRVLTFLNPESDPLGTGYNIIQSKIAIGSGGFYGKGWLHGTQSQLDFLPEHHTDFIFAVYSEEFGMMGFFLLIAIYMYIILRCLYISRKAQTTFERILAGTLSLTFFFYIFVNIGMVSGILPVVGVPLPLISYGGTSMVTLCAGFGIIMSIRTHRRITDYRY